MTKPLFIIIIFIVQLLCALFFVSDILITLFGLRVEPISWRSREIIELGAAVGLTLGVLASLIAFRATMRRSKRIERQLRAASGAFMEIVEERFEDWALTPAERDVALFAIKGLSTQDIANMRETSEGTVKAQTNAIYRKAGVAGRPQLLSLFIDDLMIGVVEKDEDAARPRRVL